MDHPAGHCKLRVTLGFFGSCTAVRVSGHSIAFLIGMIYLMLGACRGQVGSSGWSLYVRERVCCGRSYMAVPERFRG